MRYDTERAVIVTSVTELCEYAMRAGDLDLRPGMMKRATVERAAIGAEVHRKLQSEAGAMYTPEVTMRNTACFHDLAFEVSGRADGVISTEPLTVDEIKTVTAHAFDRPPAPMHDAQAKCYAYFLCREKGLDRVQTRLTYYRTEDGKTKYATTEHTADELEAFYFDLLARVEYRARVLYERETVLRPSVGSGRFPYSSVRQGQDVLLKECYRDIKAGKRLFAEAPTGIGKTVSTLYPAVRCVGEGHCDKIFYLTAKAATRREAFAAAAKIFEAGSHLRTAVLTARDQTCANAAAKADPAGVSRHCNPMDCPRAKAFYDKAPHAVCELLSERFGYTRERIEAVAEKYGICPYELQLELSEFCDIVICDYNYAFDPQVYLRRYFGAEADAHTRHVFLVDEAHNLADRARAMYSAELCSEDVAALWRQLSEGDSLKDATEKLSVTMQGFRRLCRDTIEKDEDGVERGYYVNTSPMEDFHRLVALTRKVTDTWLRTHRGDPSELAVYTLGAKLKRFEVISEYYDASFLTFIELEGDRRTVRLICLDPSHVMDACLSRAHAAVLFSATLTPIDYFADILGGGKQAVRISLPCPFDPENFCLAAVTGVSTRYEDREKSYKKLASLIAASVSAKRGNYIAYFPSYEYMEKVAEQFAKKYPTVATVRQTRGMSVAEKEKFLDAFTTDGTLRVGFCVLGGSFSEGVDLPGKRLIGSVIVGTGIPGLSNERNILRDHYETTRERGYDYAYVYPGMNRVLQAAGRVIRRESDCGVVVLIDDRYADPRTRGLFPEHWNHVEYAGNAMELAEIVREFWDKIEKNG
ncbi:MAG: ATP-dependent DNA helicase [Clostridia bacterium]|nr:ATP-dependent DNA helicase [Clostridia bacterium]